MVSQSVVRMSRSQYPMPSGTREQVQHGREDMRAKEPQQRGDCAGHDEAGFRSRCPPPPHKVQVHLGGLHATRVKNTPITSHSPAAHFFSLQSCNFGLCRPPSLTIGCLQVARQFSLSS